MNLTVFDLDHTLLKVNSSFRFGSFLYKNSYFSCWRAFACISDYFRYEWFGLSIYELHHRIFRRLFEGRNSLEICNFAAKFLTESFEEMLYSPALERLNEAMARGDYVVILSSSPDFLVEQIANRLHVVHWKGTKYCTNEQGFFYRIASVMEGEEKAKVLAELSENLKLSKENITVYSDSHLDLPMLNMAGRPVGADPNFQLKRICLRNGWEII